MSFTVLKYDDVITRIAQNKDALLINIMSEDEYNAGHIPGSVNMPLDSDSFIEDIAFYAETKDAELILYAKNSDMSLVLESAALRLQQDSFTKIALFEGGLDSWTENGAPLKTYDAPTDSGCGSCGDWAAG